MAGRRRGSPNPLLRWARVEKGWSCEELARQIVRSMGAEGEQLTGLKGETVRRWEVGQSSPTYTYRKHLVGPACLELVEISETHGAHEFAGAVKARMVAGYFRTSVEHDAHEVLRRVEAGDVAL